MRKKILVFLLILLFATALLGCSKREELPVVSFDANGGTTVGDCKNVVQSFPISRKEGYRIDGWFVDDNYTQRALFPFYVTKDTVLHAKWVSVTTGNDEIEYERIEGESGFYASSLNTKTYSVCIPDTHLGEPVYGIKRGFLTNKSYVDTLVLGKYVRDVEEELYRYSNLYTIEVSAESETFKVEHNGLIDMRTNTLVAYPRKRTETKLTVNTAISDDAFVANDTIRTLVLGADATASTKALNELKRLERYEVYGDNGTFSCKNGSLYSKDGTIFYSYPTAATGGEFTIDNAVTTVANGAFEDTTIEVLHIGANVTNFDDYSYMPKLKSYVVSSSNSAYANDKAGMGMLYSKDGKKLLRCPHCVYDVTVEEGTEEIGKFAFSDSLATEITLPASLKRIQGFAFENCASLTKVTFASDAEIEEIKDSVFSGCHNLQKLVMTSRKPPETGEYLFDSVKDGFKLVIPSNAKELYAYYWNFAYRYLDETGFPLTTYTVTFVTDGGTEIAPVHGVFIRNVADPTKNGMIFAGWYADEERSLASRTYFPYVITDHVTLYADWEYDLSQSHPGE